MRSQSQQICLLRCSLYRAIRSNKCKFCGMLRVRIYRTYYFKGPSSGRCSHLSYHGFKTNARRSANGQNHDSRDIAVDIWSYVETVSGPCESESIPTNTVQRAWTNASRPALPGWSCFCRHDSIPFANPRPCPMLRESSIPALGIKSQDGP